MNTSVQNRPVDNASSACAEAWAILPEGIADVRRFYQDQGWANLSAEEQAALMRNAEAKQQRTQREGTVAVIPVYGLISQKMSLMTAILGGTSLEILALQIRGAATDPSVSSIVLRFDSPGGSVYGLTELHSLILEARRQKPIIASVDPFMASGALWLSSAASEISCTPSGQAGSLGVLAMHVDFSGSLAKEGLKVTFVQAGRFKTEGNRYEPLSEEARAAIQEDVDTYYGMFVRDVAKGRGMQPADVKRKFGEGRMLNATEAKAAGMIDKIESFEQTVTRLARGGSSRGTRADSASLSLSAWRDAWDRRAEQVRAFNATPIPVSHLKAQLSGQFLSRDVPYDYPDRKLRIIFDRDCRFEFRDLIFCASHQDTTPLAWVRDGSLHVNLPESATCWVRKLRDTEGARRMVSDIQAGKIRGMSMRFHVTGDRARYREGGYDVLIATSAILEHICAEADPANPWTNIKVF